MVQEQKSANLEKFKKVMLSLVILLNLVVIVVLPNVGSYLSRHLPNFAINYANSLGINVTWNFFSPDPAHTMYFEYSVVFEDALGNDLKEPIEGFFPPQKEDFVRDTSDRRLLYAMRYLVLDNSRMETILAPWLCRTYPGATSVSVRHFVKVIPNLEKAVLNRDRSVESLREEIQGQNQKLTCPSVTAEVTH